MRDNDVLREELKGMTDERYYAGTRKFLQKLLDRKPVYATGFFRRRYGTRARENIRRFLRGLEAGRIGAGSGGSSLGG